MKLLVTNFMKFFRPNSKFLPAIRKIVSRNNIVIDCGCGEGQITKLLNENKINAIGIDTFQLGDFGPQPNIYNLDAERYPFSEHSIPMICRPCPGEWYFNVIDKAITSKSPFVIYIGIKKNHKRDITELKKKYTVVIAEKYVGEDNETMYLVVRKEMKEPLHINQNVEDVLTFCLVKTPYWDHPSWVEERGDKYWHNSVGGMCPKSAKDEVLEIKTGVLDFEDLDWSQCGLLEDTTECGWLSPEGNFYGCGYMGHDRVAHLILKQKPDVLMKFGWVRVHAKNDWHYCKKLSPAQQFFMENNNYDMKHHYGLEDENES